VHEDERCFYYRGYLLMCDPARLNGGGYRAQAVVCRADQTGDTLIASTQTGLVFISEGAAVMHARSWAAHWVDDQLGL
jgi:hypothetical protein